MDCPICGARFPSSNIQQHVEQCLIDQDAAMARSMSQDINPSRAARPTTAPVPAYGVVPQQRPPTMAPKTQVLYAPQTTNQAALSRVPASAPQPLYYQQPPRQQVVQPRPVAAPQVPKPLTSDSRVTGAVQSDIDQYNAKIGSSHKQLVLICDALESYAHRISLLEMRASEKIVPPVEIATLPPPRYMAIKATAQPAPSGQSPKQPLRAPQFGQVVAPGLSQLPQSANSADKRQRFFQTAQRFYNDKYGANSFFQGASQSPEPRYISHAPSSAQIVSQLQPAPPRPNATHIQAPPQHVAVPPAAKVAIEPPKAHIRKDNGITDMHMAQIESKWISMILHFPEDAGDLILGHLSMLFTQRLKNKSQLSLSSSDSSAFPNDASSGDSKANGLDSSAGLSDSKGSMQNSQDSLSKSGTEADGVAHPISEYVSQMIETWNEPFSRMREPSQETLQMAVNTVNGLISTLEAVVLDYYKELSLASVSRGATEAQYIAAENRENLVRQGVRGAVWPLFYDDLMAIIRKKCSAENVVCNQKMKEYMTMNPAHLGIPRDYWLIEIPTMEEDDNMAHAPTTGGSRSGSSNLAQGGLDASGHGNNPNIANTPHRGGDVGMDHREHRMSPLPQRLVDSSAPKPWSTPPYYSAIQTFKELSTLKSPESKLKCVVKSARDLVKSVANFHRYHGRNPDKFPVGGDELLPIFTYVVIRSGVKNLISESSFMELCISDDDSRGECGYILATLQTVIAFLTCLDNSLISQSVDSVFKSIAQEIRHETAVINQNQPEEAAAVEHLDLNQNQPINNNVNEVIVIDQQPQAPLVASEDLTSSPSTSQEKPVSVFDQHLPESAQSAGIPESALPDLLPKFDPFNYEAPEASVIEMEEFNPRAI